MLYAVKIAASAYSFNQYAKYLLALSKLTLDAAVLPASSAPVALPGGKPVIDVPGYVPALPVITVLPVLVRVVAEIAPKVLARPRTMGALRCSITGSP